GTTSAIASARSAGCCGTGTTPAPRSATLTSRRSTMRYARWATRSTRDSPRSVIRCAIPRCVTTCATRASRSARPSPPRSTRSPTRSAAPCVADRQLLSVSDARETEDGRLRDDEHAELGLDLLARLGAERSAFEAAVPEQSDERDALDLVLLRDLRLVVDVDLHDLVGALAHHRDRLDDG